MNRQEYIQSEINRAWQNESDEWKKLYYHHAAVYLSTHQYVEGGKICAYCRKQGMENPHHHNVWGAMMSSLRRMGWIHKIGMVQPTTKHTHIERVCEWESKLYNVGTI